MPYLNLPHNHGNQHTLEHIYGEIKNNNRIIMLSEIMKILSDTTRIRIFLILCHQEECVINISAMLGISSPALSHHLSLMKGCGIIERRREGKEVYYKACDNEVCKLLHEISEQIMETGCPAKKDCCSSPKEIVKNIHDYLLSNLSKRITIEELSKKFLINSTTLKKTFKEVYKMSVGAHIKMHRMELAAKLLSTTDDSVHTIAEKSGFTSQSKFAEAFKEYYSLTPSEYRKRKQ